MRTFYRSLVKSIKVIVLILRLKFKTETYHDLPYIESSLETKYREAATLPPPPRDDLRAYPDDFIRLQITTYYSDH